MKDSFMKDPFFSILLPVYNEEANVAATIESLLNQSEKDFELLIYDDASQDKSAAIIESYAQKDKRIRFLSTQRSLQTHEKINIDIAKSLNVLIEAATGKYWVRIDADDYALPDHLYEMRLYLEKNPDKDLVGTWVYKAWISAHEIHQAIQNKEKITQAVPFRYPLSEKKIYLSLLVFSPFCHCTLFLRSQFFQEKKIRYPLECLEDYALWTECARQGAKMINLPRYGIYYCHPQAEPAQASPTDKSLSEASKKESRTQWLKNNKMSLYMASLRSIYLKHYSFYGIHLSDAEINVLLRLYFPAQFHNEDLSQFYDNFFHLWKKIAQITLFQSKQDKQILIEIGTYFLVLVFLRSQKKSRKKIIRFVPQIIFRWGFQLGFWRAIMKGMVKFIRGIRNFSYISQVFVDKYF